MSDIEILLDMTYKKCVSFLKQKYGKVKYDFPNNNGKKDKLNRHHIDEDKVDALNKKENWNNYPEYQKANRLVYCTPQEHHILHINIIFKVYFLVHSFYLIFLFLVLIHNYKTLNHLSFL